MQTSAPSLLFTTCLTLIIILVSGCSDKDKPLPLSNTNEKIKIGFFSPNGIDERFVNDVRFSMLNAHLKAADQGEKTIINLEHIEKSLILAKQAGHTLHIDLGPVITESALTDSLLTNYPLNGKTETKLFSPLANNKIFRIVSDELLKQRLVGLPELLNKYKNNIGSIFLVDEPYLNGLSKNDLNNAITLLRDWFNERGYDDSSFGIIFSGVMFNQKYAEIVNSQMIKYVGGVDSYYNLNKHKLNLPSKESVEFEKWVDVIKKFRLTSYDSAENIYTGGGIPEEADVVTFDFYLSTVLFDMVHDQTLYEFGQDKLSKSCAFFTTQPPRIWRKNLSFFTNDSINTDLDIREQDKKYLDILFQCRMESAYKLLKQELRKANLSKTRVMLIGESSANGLLEFTESGVKKNDQPQLLIEQRILDEVARTIEFYKNHKESEGLMFFLYPNTYDDSINQMINGIEGSPAVTDFIYSHSSPFVKNISIDKTDRKRQ